MAQHISVDEKKELTFTMDSFQLPKELSGYTAHVQNIMNLLFYEKGTFPTCPEVGIGLRFNNFNKLNDIKNKIIPEAEYQIKEYFPEIPFVSLRIETKVADNGMVIGIFIIQLRSMTADNTIETIAVAAAEDDKTVVNWNLSI